MLTTTKNKPKGCSISINIITHNRRYLPHKVQTRIHTVKTYRQVKDISYISRKYKISKSSLMRWHKKYDGTVESLMDKSHCHKSPNSSSHTEEKLKWICDYHRRNPHISVYKLYGKLRADKGCSKHPGSLYHIFVRLGFYKKVKSTKKDYKTNKYNTSKNIGIK